MKNMFLESLEWLGNEIYKNSISKNKYFPIGAIFLNKDNEIIASSTNSKAFKKKTEHKNHAEYKCLQRIKNEIQHKKITAIISLPPCYECLQELMKYNIKWHIFYLNDDIRNKIKKKMFDEFKEKDNKIEKLYIYRLNKQTQFYYLFCITKLFEAFGTHKNPDSNTISEKIKKNEDKLRKFIKSSRPSRGQIKVDWLWKFCLEYK